MFICVELSRVLVQYFMCDLLVMREDCDVSKHIL